MTTESTDAVYLFDTSGSMGPVQLFSMGTKINQVVLGGGGTDMIAAMKAACAAKPRVLVVFTDCECDWPPQPPDGVKVVVVKHGTGKAKAPEWAQLVEVQ